MVKKIYGKNVVCTEAMENHHRLIPRSVAKVVIRCQHEDYTVLIEGEDYIQLNKIEFIPFRVKKSYNYPRGGYVLTKSGYLKVCERLGIIPSIDMDIENAVDVTPISEEEEVKPAEEIKEEPVESEKAEEEEVKLETSVATNDLDIVSELVKFFNNTTNVFMGMLEEERKLNAELRELIKASIPSIIPQNISIDLSNVTYDEYKKEIYACTDEIVALGNSKYNTRNDILRYAYNQLRAEYGIVWEQSKKDFYEEIGRSPVSTMELMWWIEQNNNVYKNLLTAKLGTIYNEAKKELEVA